MKGKDYTVSTCTKKKKHATSEVVRVAQYSLLVFLKDLSPSFRGEVELKKKKKKTQLEFLTLSITE